MILDDIKTYLEDQGFVAATIVKGQMIETPDSMLSFRETGGFPPDYVMGGDATSDEPTIQVLARAADFPTAMTIARTAYAILNGATEYLVGAEQRFGFIRTLQPPFLLMRDDNHRFICAFNIHVTRQSTVA